MQKKHDHANILAIPTDAVSKEEIVEIVETWLRTERSMEDRILRRLKKIEAMENED